MPYCPKCGIETDEKMTFCPKCGAPLKMEQPEPQARPRGERWEMREQRMRAEKEEKYEHEKTERHERREMAFMGPLVGGIILIFLGSVFYLQVTGYSAWVEVTVALFLVSIGVVIIVGAIYAATLARRRHPEVPKKPTEEQTV